MPQFQHGKGKGGGRPAPVVPAKKVGPTPVPKPQNTPKKEGS